MADKVFKDFLSLCDIGKEKFNDDTVIMDNFHNIEEELSNSEALVLLPLNHRDSDEFEAPHTIYD